MGPRGRAPSGVVGRIDPGEVVAPRRHDVLREARVEFEVCRPNLVHAEYEHHVVHPGVEDPELGEDADGQLEGEDHDRDQCERPREVGRLPDECDGHEPRRDEREEDRDPGEQLALDGRPRREQAPVLGREQLCAQLRVSVASGVVATGRPYSAGMSCGIPRLGRCKRGPSQSLGALLVVAGVVSVQIGASIAVLIFPTLGPMGVVALRIAFAAVLLLIIARPRLRGRSKADWMTVVGFGVVLAVMNTAFYFSLERIPLGVAVTIEVLGPLILSVVLGRKALSWVWAILAFVGVVILCGFGFGKLDLIGVALAAVAGVCWAAYILASARAGRRFAQLEGLALALVVSTILTLPLGIAFAGPAMLQLDVLGIALLVAALSSALPYSVELIALRRVPESTFGVLMSIEPAVAVAAGFFVLHQALTGLDLIAVVLVIAASVGAVLTGAKTQAPELTLKGRSRRRTRSDDGLPSCNPGRSSDRNQEAELTLRDALAVKASEVLLDPVGAPFARLRAVGPPAPGDQREAETKSDAVGEAHVAHGARLVGFPLLLRRVGVQKRRHDDVPHKNDETGDQLIGMGLLMKTRR